MIPKGQLFPVALLTFAIASVPLASSSLPSLYINMQKELLLFTFAVAAIATASTGRIATWAALVFVLGLLTLQNPETEIAHIRLISLASLLGIGLGLSGRLSGDNLASPFRALSIVVILLGIDALRETARLPTFAGFVAPFFGRPISSNAFSLIEDPEVRRAASFLGNPNRLGAFCAIAVPLLIGARVRDREARFLHIAGIVLGVIAVLVSYSRGAYIGLFAALAVIAFMRVRTAKIDRIELAALSILLIGGIAWGIPRAWTIIDSADPRQWQDRFTIWRGALDAISDRPLAGWGLGGFGPAFSLHAPAKWWEFVAPSRMTYDAHNEYLEAGVEFGLAGFILLISGIALLGRATRLRIRRDTNAIPYAAALLAAAIAALFSSILRFAPTGLLVILSAFALFPVEHPGKSLFSRTRTIGAMLLFASVLAPFLSDSYFRHAYAANREGDKTMLGKWIAISRGLRPDDPTPLYAAAIPNLPDSDRTLIALAQRYPGYRDVEWKLAEGYEKAGRFDESAAWYEKACRLKPTLERIEQWSRMLAKTGREPEIPVEIP